MPKIYFSKNKFYFNLSKALQTSSKISTVIVS